MIGYLIGPSENFVSEASASGFSAAAANLVLAAVVFAIQEFRGLIRAVGTGILWGSLQ